MTVEADLGEQHANGRTHGVPRTSPSFMRYAIIIQNSATPKSTNPLDALAVALATPDIDVGARPDEIDRRLIERADRARGRAHDQRIVRKAFAFGDQGAGSAQAVVADLGAVEHDRAHADQAVRSEGRRAG